MSTRAKTAQMHENFASDVRCGLIQPGQKTLPSKYLYDTVGSALFEVISVLPEYGLTRADERILRHHAEAIVEQIPSPVIVAELGSGSGRKTRWILQALSHRQETRYFPIEISKAALMRCHIELGQLPSVRIFDCSFSYLDGLRKVASRREPGECILVLFLGSTIGNFDRNAGRQFLSDLRTLLSPGDGILLGADLVKPVGDLLLAYDDPLGVTAAFNLNLLARINRELDGDFDLRRFQHQVRYESSERRIEMHLRSLVNQTVTIPKASCRVQFLEDETIWTESCHKYDAAEVAAMGSSAGLECRAQWIDPEWPFAETLFIAV